MNYPANETWGNRQPVCPYCKTKIDFDDCPVRDDEEREEECPQCEKRFWIKTRVEIRFDSMGDCRLNDELPHKLKLMFDLATTKEYRCIKCDAEIYDWQLTGERAALKPHEFEVIK